MVCLNDSATVPPYEKDAPAAPKVHELLGLLPHPSPDTHEEELVTVTIETNKNVVRAFVAAWNDRDFDAFDELMGKSAVLTVGGQAVPGDPAGTRPSRLTR